MIDNEVVCSLTFDSNYRTDETGKPSDSKPNEAETTENKDTEMHVDEYEKSDASSMMDNDRRTPEDAMEKEKMDVRDFQDDTRSEDVLENEELSIIVETNMDERIEKSGSNGESRSVCPENIGDSSSVENKLMHVKSLVSLSYEKVKLCGLSNLQVGKMQENNSTETGITDRGKSSVVTENSMFSATFTEVGERRENPNENIQGEKGNSVTIETESGQKSDLKEIETKKEIKGNLPKMETKSAGKGTLSDLPVWPKRFTACPAPACSKRMFKEFGDFINHWNQKHVSHTCFWFCILCKQKLKRPEQVLEHDRETDHHNEGMVIAKMFVPNKLYIDGKGALPYQPDDCEDDIGDEEIPEAGKESQGGIHQIIWPQTGAPCTVPKCSRKLFNTYADFMVHWQAEHKAPYKRLWQCQVCFKRFEKEEGALEHKIFSLHPEIDITIRKVMVRNKLYIKPKNNLPYSEGTPLVETLVTKSSPLVSDPKSHADNNQMPLDFQDKGPDLLEKGPVWPYVSTPCPVPSCETTSFDTLSEFQRHWILVHQSVRTIHECLICSQQFADQKHLEQHQFLQHNGHPQRRNTVQVVNPLYVNPRGVHPYWSGIEKGKALNIDVKVNKPEPAQSTGTIDSHESGTLVDSELKDFIQTMFETSDSEQDILPGENIGEMVQISGGIVDPRDYEKWPEFTTFPEWPNTPTQCSVPGCGERKYTTAKCFMTHWKKFHIPKVVISKCEICGQESNHVGFMNHAKLHGEVKPQVKSIIVWNDLYIDPKGKTPYRYYPDKKKTENTDKEGEIKENRNTNQLQDTPDGGKLLDNNVSLECKKATKRHKESDMDTLVQKKQKMNTDSLTAVFDTKTHPTNLTERFISSKKITLEIGNKSVKERIGPVWPNRPTPCRVVGCSNSVKFNNLKEFISHWRAFHVKVKWVFKCTECQKIMEKTVKPKTHIDEEHAGKTVDVQSVCVPNSSYIAPGGLKPFIGKFDLLKYGKAEKVSGIKAGKDTVADKTDNPVWPGVPTPCQVEGCSSIMSFPSQDKYMMHWKISHEKKRATSRCSLCNKLFYGPKEAEAHKKSKKHVGKKDFIVPLQNIPFIDPEGVRPYTGQKNSAKKEEACELVAHDKMKNDRAQIGLAKCFGETPSFEEYYLTANNVRKGAATSTEADDELKISESEGPVMNMPGYQEKDSVDQTEKAAETLSDPVNIKERIIAPEKINMDLGNERVKERIGPVWPNRPTPCRVVGCSNSVKFNNLKEFISHWRAFHVKVKWVFKCIECQKIMEKTVKPKTHIDEEHAGKIVDVQSVCVPNSSYIAPGGLKPFIGKSDLLKYRKAEIVSGIKAGKDTVADKTDNPVWPGVPTPCQVEGCSSIMSFPSQDKYMMHWKISHEKKRATSRCSLCNKLFYGPKEAEAHKKSKKHVGKKDFIVPLQNLPFIDPEGARPYTGQRNSDNKEIAGEIVANDQMQNDIAQNGLAKTSGETHSMEKCSLTANNVRKSEATSVETCDELKISESEQPAMSMPGYQEKDSVDQTEQAAETVSDSKMDPANIKERIIAPEKVNIDLGNKRVKERIGPLWPNRPTPCRVVGCSNSKKFNNLKEFISHWRAFHVKVKWVFKCTECQKIMEKTVKPKTHIDEEHAGKIVDVQSVCVPNSSYIAPGGLKPFIGRTDFLKNGKAEEVSGTQVGTNSVETAEETDNPVWPGVPTPCQVEGCSSFMLFNSLGRYMRHWENSHEKKRATSKCCLCNKVFFEPNEAEAHKKMKKHAGKKDFIFPLQKLPFIDPEGVRPYTDQYISVEKEIPSEIVEHDQPRKNDKSQSGLTNFSGDITCDIAEYSLTANNVRKSEATSSEAYDKLKISEPEQCLTSESCTKEKEKGSLDKSVKAAKIGKYPVWPGIPSPCRVQGCPKTKLFKTFPGYMDHWNRYHEETRTAYKCNNCNTYINNFEHERKKGPKDCEAHIIIAVQVPNGALIEPGCVKPYRRDSNVKAQNDWIKVKDMDSNTVQTVGKTCISDNGTTEKGEIDTKTNTGVSKKTESRDDIKNKSLEVPLVSDTASCQVEQCKHLKPFETRKDYMLHWRSVHEKSRILFECSLCHERFESHLIKCHTRMKHAGQEVHFPAVCVFNLNYIDPKNAQPFVMSIPYERNLLLKATTQVEEQEICECEDAEEDSDTFLNEKIKGCDIDDSYSKIRNTDDKSGMASESTLLSYTDKGLNQCMDVSKRRDDQIVQPIWPGKPTPCQVEGCSKTKLLRDFYDYFSHWKTLHRAYITKYKCGLCSKIMRHSEQLKHIKTKHTGKELVFSVVKCPNRRYRNPKEVIPYRIEDNDNKQQKGGEHSTAEVEGCLDKAFESSESHAIFTDQNSEKCTDRSLIYDDCEVKGKYEPVVQSEIVELETDIKKSKLQTLNLVKSGLKSLDELVKEFETPVQKSLDLNDDIAVNNAHEVEEQLLQTFTKPISLTLHEVFPTSDDFARAEIVKVDVDTANAGHDESNHYAADQNIVMDQVTDLINISTQLSRVPEDTSKVYNHVSKKTSETTFNIENQIWPGVPTSCQVQGCTSNELFRKFWHYMSHWNSTHVETLKVFKCTSCNALFKSSKCSKVHCKTKGHTGKDCITVLEVPNTRFVDPKGIKPFRKEIDIHMPVPTYSADSSKNGQGENDTAVHTSRGGNETTISNKHIDSGLKDKKKSISSEEPGSRSTLLVKRKLLRSTKKCPIWPDIPTLCQVDECKNSEPFKTFNDYVSHWTSFHKETSCMYQCSLCSKQLESRKDIKDHRQTIHTGKEVFFPVVSVPNCQYIDPKGIVPFRKQSSQEGNLERNCFSDKPHNSVFDQTERKTKEPVFCETDSFDQTDRPIWPGFPTPCQVEECPVKLFIDFEDYWQHWVSVHKEYKIAYKCIACGKKVKESQQRKHIESKHIGQTISFIVTKVPKPLYKDPKEIKAFRVKPVSEQQNLSKLISLTSAESANEEERTRSSKTVSDTAVKNDEVPTAFGSDNAKELNAEERSVICLNGTVSEKQDYEKLRIENAGVSTLENDYGENGKSSIQDMNDDSNQVVEDQNIQMADITSTVMGARNIFNVLLEGVDVQPSFSNLSSGITTLPNKQKLITCFVETAKERQQMKDCKTNGSDIGNTASDKFIADGNKSVYQRNDAKQNVTLEENNVFSLLRQGEVLNDRNELHYQSSNQPSIATNVCNETIATNVSNEASSESTKSVAIEMVMLETNDSVVPGITEKIESTVDQAFNIIDLNLNAKTDDAGVSHEKTFEADSSPIWPGIPSTCPVKDCSVRKQFKTFKQFTGHWESVHTEFINSYQCELCKATFKQSFRAERHKSVKSHTGENVSITTIPVPNPMYVDPKGVQAFTADYSEEQLYRNEARSKSKENINKTRQDNGESSRTERSDSNVEDTDTSKELQSKDEIETKSEQEEIAPIEFMTTQDKGLKNTPNESSNAKGKEEQLCEDENELNENIRETSTEIFKLKDESVTSQNGSVKNVSRKKTAVEVSAEMEITCMNEDNNNTESSDIFISEILIKEPNSFKVSSPTTCSEQPSTSDSVYHETPENSEKETEESKETLNNKAANSVKRKMEAISNASHTPKKAKNMDGENAEDTWNKTFIQKNAHAFDSPRSAKLENMIESEIRKTSDSSYHGSQKGKGNTVGIQKKQQFDILSLRLFDPENYKENCPVWPLKPSPCPVPECTKLGNFVWFSQFLDHWKKVHNKHICTFVCIPCLKELTLDDAKQHKHKGMAILKIRNMKEVHKSFIKIIKPNKLYVDPKGIYPFKITDKSCSENPYMTQELFNMRPEVVTEETNRKKQNMADISEKTTKSETQIALKRLDNSRGSVETKQEGNTVHDKIPKKNLPVWKDRSPCPVPTCARNPEVFVSFYSFLLHWRVVHNNSTRTYTCQACQAVHSSLDLARTHKCTYGHKWKHMTQTVIPNSLYINTEGCLPYRQLEDDSVEHWDTYPYITNDYFNRTPESVVQEEMSTEVQQETKPNLSDEIPQKNLPVWGSSAAHCPVPACKDKFPAFQTFDAFVKHWKLTHNSTRRIFICQICQKEYVGYHTSRKHKYRGSMYVTHGCENINEYLVPNSSYIDPEGHLPYRQKKMLSEKHWNRQPYSSRDYYNLNLKQPVCVENIGDAGVSVLYEMGIDSSHDEKASGLITVEENTKYEQAVEEIIPISEKAMCDFKAELAYTNLNSVNQETFGIPLPSCQMFAKDTTGLFSIETIPPAMRNGSMYDELIEPLYATDDSANIANKVDGVYSESDDAKQVLNIETIVGHYNDRRRDSEYLEQMYNIEVLAMEHHYSAELDNEFSLSQEISAANETDASLIKHDTDDKNNDKRIVVFTDKMPICEKLGSTGMSLDAFTENKRNGLEKSKFHSYNEDNSYSVKDDPDSKRDVDDSIHCKSPEVPCVESGENVRNIIRLLLSDDNKAEKMPMSKSEFLATQKSERNSTEVQNIEKSSHDPEVLVKKPGEANDVDETLSDISDNSMDFGEDETKSDSFSDISDTTMDLNRDDTVTNENKGGDANLTASAFRHRTELYQGRNMSSDPTYYFRSPDQDIYADSVTGIRTKLIEEVPSSSFQRTSYDKSKLDHDQQQRSLAHSVQVTKLSSQKHNPSHDQQTQMVWPSVPSPCTVQFCQSFGKFITFEEFMDHWNKVHRETISAFQCTFCNMKFSQLEHAEGHSNPDTHRGHVFTVNLAPIKNQFYVDPKGVLPYKYVSPEEQEKLESAQSLLMSIRAKLDAIRSKEEKN